MTGRRRRDAAAAADVRSGMRVVAADGRVVGTVAAVDHLGADDRRDAASSLMQVLADGLTGSPPHDDAWHDVRLTVTRGDGDTTWIVRGPEVRAISDDTVHLLFSPGEAEPEVL